MAHADSIEDAVRRGDPATARALLEAKIAGKPNADLHRQHLEGLIALQQGDGPRAARIFRAILAQDPGYAPAQLQLIVALDLMGQETEAIRQAERLAATTEDARLRDSLVAEVALRKSARPGGVALRFSLLPSTNITGGTALDSVTIGGLPLVLDPASREASGIGVNLGLTAWHGWKLSDEWRVTLSGSVDRRLYDTSLHPDETELGLRLDFARKTKRVALIFGPRIGALFQHGHEVRRQHGISGRGIWRVSPRLDLSFSAEWMQERYPDAPYRDGHTTSARLGLAWMISPTTRLTVELPVEREKAAAAHLSHRDIGLAIGIDTRLKGGMGLGLDLSVARSRYDGPYPLFGERRDDRITSLRLSVSHPDISLGGLTPEFSVTRKHQDSNIPLHDTWTTDFGLSLVKRF
ncbi:MAG: surface lipoprotein assembly modifier [Paracoccaceae bacterium]